MKKDIIYKGKVITRSLLQMPITI